MRATLPATRFARGLEGRRARVGNASHIQLSNSPTRAYLQTRVIAPVLCPAWGCRSSVAFRSPERACGTTGRKTAPAAPACFQHAGNPYAERDGTRAVKLNKPRTQFFACVPHAMAFSVCSMSPGVVTSADFAQFVRTVARTLTWTVRPCCRRLFLQYLGALPLASKDRHRGEPPHPAPRSKDGSNAPSHRSGTGEE